MNIVFKLNYSYNTSVDKANVVKTPKHGYGGGNSEENLEGRG